MSSANMSLRNLIRNHWKSSKSNLGPQEALREERFRYQQCALTRFKTSIADIPLRAESEKVSNPQIHPIRNVDTLRLAHNVTPSEFIKIIRYFPLQLNFRPQTTDRCACSRLCGGWCSCVAWYLFAGNFVATARFLSASRRTNILPRLNNIGRSTRRMIFGLILISFDFCWFSHLRMRNLDMHRRHLESKWCPCSNFKLIDWRRNSLRLVLILLLADIFRLKLLFCCFFSHFICDCFRFAFENRLVSPYDTHISQRRTWIFMVRVIFVSYASYDSYVFDISKW